MYSLVYTDFEEANYNFDNSIIFTSHYLGLALYKLMEYLTKKNRRKIMARHGLKQIGEHMHVVTRTMSADPSGMY